MIRPECYQCASCGRSWSHYFPALICRCGGDAVRRTDGELLSVARASVAAVEVAGGLLDNLAARQRRIARAVNVSDPQVFAWRWLSSSLHWSPYPVGNGSDGSA